MRQDILVSGGIYSRTLAEQDRQSLLQVMTHEELEDLIRTGSFSTDLGQCSNFMISDRLLTVGDWKVYLNESGFVGSSQSSSADDLYWNEVLSTAGMEDFHPIVGLTVSEALSVAEWMGYRLPTEAELEYWLIRENCGPYLVDKRRKRWKLRFGDSISAVKARYAEPNVESWKYLGLPCLLTADTVKCSEEYPASRFHVNYKPGGLFFPYLHVCGRVEPGYFNVDYIREGGTDSGPLIRVRRMYQFCIPLARSVHTS